MKIQTPSTIAYTKLRSLLDTEEYRHEFSHFFEWTIKTLWKNEVVKIHQLLILGILTGKWRQKNNQIKRPTCPVTWPRKLNQAKADYKIAMIAYIGEFGIHLTGNAPCNYPPAILEALANYCEKNL